MFTLRIWISKSGVLKKNYSFLVSMVRRRISEAQRWQIIGIHTTGMSFKAIGGQMGYHYTVVSRLVRKHTQTNNVRLAKIRQTTGNISS
jgi:IS30 family transposase